MSRTRGGNAEAGEKFETVLKGDVIRENSILAVPHNPGQGNRVSTSNANLDSPDPQR